MIVFTEISLERMKQANVSEKTVMEAFRQGHVYPFKDMLVCMKKYGSYDLFITFKRRGGTTYILSVKRRSNTRNIKHWW